MFETLDPETKEIKSHRGIKVNNKWLSKAKLSKGGKNSTQMESVKKIINAMSTFIDQKTVWAMHRDVVSDHKQALLLEKGADWVTPLGGRRSRVTIHYVCINCMMAPVSSADWFFFVKEIHVIVEIQDIDGHEVAVEKCIKIAPPKGQWRCALCNMKYAHQHASRILCLDPRLSPTDEDPLFIVALANDANQESAETVELFNKNEYMISWLQHVTLINQIDTKITRDAVLDAISSLNHLVVNKLGHSRTVQWKKVINQYEDESCKYQQHELIMVSSSPELSLGQLGGHIPVLPVPNQNEYGLRPQADLNKILAMVGATVINNDAPGHHVKMGDTQTIPRIYKRGHEAFREAAQRARDALGKKD